MEETVLQIINHILKKKSKPHLERLDMNLDLREDLGFDSLDLAELTVRIEDETGVDIFAHRIISKVGEIFEELERARR